MVNTMENAEEVMQILDRFTRLKQKEIPKELDDYLQYVAKTGDTVFKWSSLKYLFREKLLNVIKHFHDTTPRVDEIPQYPNVDPFNYESMKSSLLERLEHFNAAPFTIQRLCELLIDPRKQYSRIDKFMRALEKNILVVSTVEPGRKRTDSENGDSLDSVVNGDLSLDVNVDIEMDNEALFAIEGQNGNGAVPVAVAAAVVEALNEKSAVENSNTSRSGDDDILPHPKKAKLELNDSEKKAEAPQAENVAKELNTNGNEAAKVEAVEKVEEKKVEENGNTENVKPIEVVEKQNDAEMEDKTSSEEVKKVEEIKEDIVAEIQKETAEIVKEIPTEHKSESDLNNKEEEVAKEEKSNAVTEKEVEVQQVDVKEPQTVLKHIEEKEEAAEVKTTAVEKQDEVKTETTATPIKKIAETIGIEKDAVESAAELTPTAITPTIVTTPETTHKKEEIEKENTEKEIEKEPLVVKEKTSTETSSPVAAVAIEEAKQPTSEIITEQVPEKLAETAAVVEEKVLEKEVKTDTTMIAAKLPAETEKELLTASSTDKPIDEVKTETIVAEATVVASVAEEQKTEQTADKVATNEKLSSAAKPAEIVAEAVTIVAVEAENMQMPIETDSPAAAAGIDIDEMPSAVMVSGSELAVAAVIATPADNIILAPALSLNDQPMEDLPMEESAPEEVIMAETVATGNNGLIEMTTDAMEAAGKQEQPVDGMDVDDTSQEAMDQ